MESRAAPDVKESVSAISVSVFPTGGRRERAAQKKYVLRERPQGDFTQTFTLDETVDQTRVDALLEKGILMLTLDLKEQVKPRRIPVRGE